MKKIAKIILTGLICGSFFFITACNNDLSEVSSNSSSSSEKYEQDEQYEIYVLALSEGKFTGTYEEWLASIKGEDGKPGKNGLSAFELYKSIHPEYKGSLEEWLNSFNGADGKSAYELYKESHPEYTKSETEWLDDLTNGRLGNIVKHTVRFDEQGGSIVEDQEIDHLCKVEKPNIAKEGYTLDGWYIDDEKWVFSGYNVTQDIILTAHWIPIDYEITIDYDNGSKPDKFVKHYGDEFDLVEPIKTGYIFDYWSNDGINKIELPISVNEDLNLKAVYTYKVNVSFNTNGGDNIEPMEFIHNKNMNNLPIPVKDGYKFNGWSYNDGNKEIMLDSPYNCVFENDITLNAHWIETINDFNFETLSNNQLMVTEYLGTDKNVVIPNYVNNKPVTSIGENAFKNKNFIESITLGDNVEYINTNSLIGCKNLKKFEFNELISDYPESLFVDCLNIEELTIRNNISLYELFSFDENNIPGSLNKINILSSDSSTTKEKLFNHVKNTKYNVELIGNWTDIPYSFFENTDITSVIIPKTVTTFNGRAFSGCVNLSNIDIPTSVTYLGDYCFQNCRNIESFLIPDNIIQIGGNAFAGCVKINSFDLPHGLERLEDGLFSGCANLKCLSIPSAVKFIGNYCFSSCWSLASIFLPKSIISLGNIYNIPPRTTYIYYQGTKKDWFNLQKNFDETVITKIKVVCDPNLTDIEYYNNELGEYVLTNTNDLLFCKMNNQNIKELDFNKQFNGKNLTYINFEAFRDCNNIETIILNGSLSVIEGNTFYSCINLKTIVLPANLLKISEQAFYGCISLKNVFIPKSVEIIESHAFYTGSQEIIINCEAESKPSGWSENWNPSNSPVNWGVKK